MKSDRRLARGWHLARRLLNATVGSSTSATRIMYCGTVAIQAIHAAKLFNETWLA
jgi:hypothetical protein